MRLDYLKKTIRKLPNCMKRLIGPYARKRLINNPVFVAQFEALISRNSSEELPRLSRNLRETLIYAYENTAYYKEKWDHLGIDVYEMDPFEALKSMPLLTKSDVVKHYEALLSNKEMDYYHANTGGTSGEPLKLSLSIESVYREKAFIYAYWTRFGYDHRKSQMISFSDVGNSKDLYIFNPVDNMHILSPFRLTKSTLPAYLDVIRRVRPDFIHGYPSSILHFCKLLESKKAEIPPIKGVFLISENSALSDRQHMETVLKATTHSFYGHSERCVFAEEAGTLDYRFNNEYGYTETLRLEDNRHDTVVATGFLNRKMPLIRYVTEDLVDSCENHIHIVGRDSGTVLFGKQGEWVNEQEVDIFDDEFSHIYYQCIQNTVGKVEVRVGNSNALDSDTRQRIEALFCRLFDGIFDFTFVYDDTLILTKRGKFKRIIQYIKKESNPSAR